MELHSPQGPGAVPQPHQDAILGPGGGLQGLGQRLAHGQRVVADRGEVLRQPLEQVPFVVPDRGQMTVPGLRGGQHPAPLAQRDALVAEADAEHRDRGLGEHSGAESEVTFRGRVPGTGRHHHIVEFRKIRNSVRGGVIEDHHRLLAVDLGDQLEQVVRVRVVIVDEQGLHPPTSLWSFSGLRGPFMSSTECLERWVQPFLEETLKARHENPGDEGRHTGTAAAYG